MRRGIKYILYSVVFVVVAILILGIGGYFVYTTDMWLKMPKGIRGQIAFTKLEVLSYEPICHESCMLEKSLYEDIVAQRLIDDPIVMESQVKDYLNMPKDKVIPQMKKDLVRIVKQAEEMKKRADDGYEMQIPDYLLDYLNDPQADMNVKHQIMASFDQQLGASSWLVNGLLDTIRDKSKSIDERIPAILDLVNIASKSKEDGTPKYGNINYAELCQLFMDIVQDKEEDDKVRNAVLTRMYACTKFPGNYTEEMFEKIKKIFEDKDEHLGIRDAALTRLSIYDDVSTSTAGEYMDKVYNDKDEHEFLRFGAWAFFKERDDNSYEEPEIDGETFDSYLNKTGDIWYVRKSY